MVDGVSGVVLPQAYSCGRKKAKAEGKNSSERKMAGKARQEKILDECCKKGVKVALAFRDQ